MTAAVQLSLFASSAPAPSPVSPDRPAELAQGDINLLLAARLASVGLPGTVVVRSHQNRSVMVSQARGGVLRIHRGYINAPDAVLRAVIRFLAPRTPRAARLAARAELLAFPVEQYAPSPPRRSEPLRRGDRRLLAELRQLHRQLNAEYFHGLLSAAPIRLSARMRTRLGEVRLLQDRGHPVEIALSRRHLARDPWPEVRETLLHEMIHQWQAESGRPVDHGPAFRRKARQVGVEPRAVRGEQGGMGTS